MRIAVTGATGAVGEFVVTALLARGHHVTALSRSNKTPLVDRLGVTWLTGDITEVETQRSILADADALVHCAFNHVPGRYRGGEGGDSRAFWQDNFLSTLDLLATAENANVSRVVLLSSRAVFDAIEAQDLAVDGRIGDNAGVAANTHYGAMKAAIEGLARAVTGQSRLSVTTLRPTGVYGVRRQIADSKWYGLAERALRDSGAHSADTEHEDRLVTEVHGDDVASAVCLLLEAKHEDVAGRTFNCSDIALSQGELTKALRALAAGSSIENLFNHLHPTQWPARSLSCDGLRELGWQPSGRAALVDTLEQLAASVRDDTDKIS